MNQLTRRDFILTSSLLGASVLIFNGCDFLSRPHNSGLTGGVSIDTPLSGEDIFAFIQRVKGRMDLTLYRQIIGSANEFKEGDLIVGVAADNQSSRLNARTLLSNTRLDDLVKNPLFDDGILTLINSTTLKDPALLNLTMGKLKDYVLNKPENEIKIIMPYLTSDIIACLVKLMSNEELISVGQKVFNPLPRSHIGSKGYLSARIQPNSPTDNIEDITWQVFNAWSFGVGDLMLGTNPVSSNPDSVAKIESALHDIITTFDLRDTLPHSVLAHIDIQLQLEGMQPGTTGIWFQSLAGTENANLTFNITIDKMFCYASIRNGLYGMYAETGQGADFTNGHGEGFDMVVHEARKYGFLRALKKKMYALKTEEAAPWVFSNDVAGFIGPEVFRTKEQLVRCCLEDTVMSKLHGLTSGLDICSTLHMDVSLDDLDWCIEQIIPVNPAYLMALPTKNDPMLSYLTTAFSDHVKIREKFGYKVDDSMWNFFKRLEVIDKSGRPTSHFGDPVWVYYQYCRAKHDDRSMTEIFEEGKKCIERIKQRGVSIAEGYGQNIWDLNPELDKEVRRLYEDAKVCIWTEMKPSFIAEIPASVSIITQSKDRKDYLYHPESGEKLSDKSRRILKNMSQRWGNKIPDIQIIISDGLNANALMGDNHLLPFLTELSKSLQNFNYQVGKENIVITTGRVRAGYECGKVLFGAPTDSPERKGIIHIIGERPGNGHNCFSSYITVAPISSWFKKNMIDHNITKVVSGISDTSLKPELAAKDTIDILNKLFAS
jgi:ethanolamine ammonia-lyase large subunit